MSETDFWKKKYDELLEHLKEEYGPSWLLFHLQEIEERGEEE